MNAPELSFPNLGIRINRLPREAFNIFGLPVYWYGILIVTGVLLGVLYAVREAKRTSQDPDIYFDAALYLVFAGAVGARLYYVIFSWDLYRNDLLKIFAVREGGLAIYGGVIGGFISALIYTKIKKIKLMKFIDIAIVSVLIGQIVGRWGNLFNREAFGGYTESLFAMRYLYNQVMYVPASLEANLIISDSTAFIQVHPTFLYESVWNLALLLIILFARKRKKYDGQIFMIYLCGYGIGRLWIEGMRSDQLLVFGIPVSMIVSAMIAIFVVVYAIIKRRQLAFDGTEYDSPFMPEEVGEVFTEDLDESGEELPEAESGFIEYINNSEDNLDIPAESEQETDKTS